MSNEYTLLVIDMQPEFRASNDVKTLRECAKQIRRAIKYNQPVVFAEFVRFGPTHTSLTKLVKEYDRSFTFLKNRESGAIEFENVISHFSFPKKIRVVGVNTDQCVLYTVRDLSSGGFSIKEITVISDACNTDTDTDRENKNNERGFAIMATFDHVKVI